MAKNAIKIVEDNSNEVAIPDFLQADVGMGMGLESIDKSLLSIPRISLMHPLSKPVEDGMAKAGHYWHNILQQDLGDNIVAVPVYSEIGWTLWDPTPGAGVLARGRRNDKGVWVWDPSDTKFEVMYNKQKVVWDTKGSIAESKLAKWDEKNPPPAKQSINILFALPEHGPDAYGVMSFAKSAFPVGRALIQQLHAKSTLPTFAYKFRLESTSTNSKSGQKFLVPKVIPDGMVDNKALYEACKAMYMRVRVIGLSGYSNEGEDAHDEVAVGGDAIDASEF